MTRGKIIKYAVFLTVVLVIGFLAAAGVLIWSGLRDDIQHADVALVLGNTVEPNGDPSPRLQARLDRTLELYRQGYFSTVIVSGGIGNEGYDESVVMKKYLAGHGIPDAQIIPDNQGLTTYLSAKNTLRILHEKKWGSVLVISQYFHIPRTKLALKKFGISPVNFAHAHYFETRDLYSICRELFGYVEYQFLRYGISSEDEKK